MWSVSGNRDAEMIEDAEVIEDADSFIRLADLQIEVLGEPTHVTSNFIRGIRSMPVRIAAEGLRERAPSALAAPSWARIVASSVAYIATDDATLLAESPNLSP